MELTQEVYNVGRDVVLATGATAASVLNGSLTRFIGWPFKITSGFAVDRGGARSPTFASMIHTGIDGATAIDPDAIPADSLAAVIDVYESMDLENFRSAYRRISQAKTLKKSPAPNLEGAIPITTTTLGVIFALRSALPLDALAEELDCLNVQTPSQQWPDMIVVASAGVINYMAHFPGEPLKGDFLPPAEGALAAYIPPMYVVIVMRPTGAYSFNKMMAFLIAHLAIFSPGAKLPNWTEILEGVTQHAVTISGYQYNLAGELLPVPRQFYNDRYIAPVPVRIEDRKGELLSTLQFLPWQDGGVILLKGKLPLEGLLVFLGKKALQRGNIVNLPPAQISHVMPITQMDFTELLTRIQRQTNMVVRVDTPNWVVQKLEDEGSQSPYIARLLIGILRLRDAVFPDPAERIDFDKSYEIVNSSFFNTRTTAHQIVQLWKDHIRKVVSGEVARVQGNTIRIDESIDKELRKQVESFLNTAVRALKQGMQNLAKELQVDIGFLFKQQTTFDRGVAALERTDPHLSEYLIQNRIWSERLVESRNDIEHRGWILPRIRYTRTSSGIRADEPIISGQPVSEFVNFMLDRMACFIEELTAHCLNKKMPMGITITEIPLAHRVVDLPARFTLTLANGGLPEWTIVFHRTSFDET